MSQSIEVPPCFLVKDWIWATDAHVSEKAVMTALLLHVNKDFLAYPSQDRLARYASVSREEIARKWLPRLAVVDSLPKDRQAEVKAKFAKIREDGRQRRRDLEAKLATEKNQAKRKRLKANLKLAKEQERFRPRRWLKFCGTRHRCTIWEIRWSQIHKDLERQRDKCRPVSSAHTSVDNPVESVDNPYDAARRSVSNGHTPCEQCSQDPVSSAHTNSSNRTHHLNSPSGGGASGGGLASLDGEKKKKQAFGLMFKRFRSFHRALPETFYGWRGRVVRVNHDWIDGRRAPLYRLHDLTTGSRLEDPRHDWGPDFIRSWYVGETDEVDPDQVEKINGNGNGSQAPVDISDLSERMAFS